MKLSIVIPTYNRAKILPRAIASVWSQNHKDWELIIVDDGSTDNTAKVVSTFKDKRIKFYKLKSNQGFLQARNIGAAKSQGDWVCFLDSDDEYLPGALAIMSKELKKVDKKIGVVQFMLRASNIKEKLGFRRNNNNWSYYQPSYEEIVLKKGIKQDMHRCLRKQIAWRYSFDKDNPGLETLHYADLAKAGVKLLYVNRPTVRVHQGNSSHNQVRFKRWPKEFARAYAKLITKHSGVFQKHKQRLFDHQIRIMRCYLRARDPRFLWWAGRAFFNQPKKFIAGVKRII